MHSNLVTHGCVDRENIFPLLNPYPANLTSTVLIDNGNECEVKYQKHLGYLSFLYSLTWAFVESTIKTTEV